MSRERGSGERKRGSVERGGCERGGREGKVCVSPEREEKGA